MLFLADIKDRTKYYQEFLALIFGIEGEQVAIWVANQERLAIMESIAAKNAVTDLQRTNNEKDS